MKLPFRITNVPLRVATGAFIAHSGWEKWNAGPDVAAGTHGFATSAYPALADVPPGTFLKGLAAGEMLVGGLLLAPTVSPTKAGLGLTAFATGLLGLYAKAPGLRREGSIWPTQDGLAVSKDVWLLGIGLALAAQAGSDERKSAKKLEKKARKAAEKGVEKVR